MPFASWLPPDVAFHPMVSIGAPFNYYNRILEGCYTIIHWKFNETIKALIYIIIYLFSGNHFTKNEMIVMKNTGLSSGGREGFAIPLMWGFALGKLPYGAVRSPVALGKLMREERKRQALTQRQVYAATGLSTRFLSEFERGKPNASIGRVLDALAALGLELQFRTNTLIQT